MDHVCRIIIFATHSASWEPSRAASSLTTKNHTSFAALSGTNNHLPIIQNTFIDNSNTNFKVECSIVYLLLSLEDRLIHLDDRTKRWRENIDQESQLTYDKQIFFPQKKKRWWRGKGRAIGQWTLKTQNKLTGARIELAIYRFHNVDNMYETIALTS